MHRLVGHPAGGRARRVAKEKEGQRCLAVYDDDDEEREISGEAQKGFSHGFVIEVVVQDEHAALLRSGADTRQMRLGLIEGLPTSGLPMRWREGRGCIFKGMLIQRIDLEMLHDPVVGLECLRQCSREGRFAGCRQATN